jgi:uncharacterized repeat protein (TIGR03803 family)
MKLSAFSALSSCVAVALLTGCNATGGALQAPTNASAQASFLHSMPLSSSYRLLYHFPRLADDGFNPEAPLVDVNGTLYGTTMYGGGSTNCAHGCGTVFSLDASGTEKIVHNFAGGSDGAYPAAALLDVNGVLYGTTQAGGGKCGGNGCGTVYSISASGSEIVIHSFGGGSDGYDPAAPLIDVNGVLYGTTVYGGTGSSPNGTVYSITPSGSEHVLHYFTCAPDGCLPFGDLVSVNGTLYGTTNSGGQHCSGGCGTVYSISTSGSEKVLYSFVGGSDGERPLSGLTNVNGTLYGTTNEGGGSGCKYGCGTAYSITTTGTEKVLHSFTGGRDGEFVHAGLIDVNGMLYGTTVSGGESSCVIHELWFDYDGCGTIYSLTTTGREKVLFHFKSKGDGEPASSLLDVGGVLYGTTPRTSNRECGDRSITCGTAFAFTL